MISIAAPKRPTHASPSSIPTPPPPPKPEDLFSIVTQFDEIEPLPDNLPEIIAPTAEKKDLTLTNLDSWSTMESDAPAETPGEGKSNLWSQFGEAAKMKVIRVGASLFCTRSPHPS